MQDHHVFPPSPRRRRPDGTRRGGADGLGNIANWAIALLAARRATSLPRLRADLFDGLHDAVIDPDEQRMAAFLAHMVRERVTAAAVADLYIPELARRLGQEWMDDSLSFVQVSLGTARMQAMLRAIGCAWSADSALPGGTPGLALVVPRGEQHTLGALVLLGQLRRLGVTVRLMLGPKRGEVGAVLARGGLSGVLVSVSGKERLGDVFDLVKEVRADGPPGIPVVLGGAVLMMDMDAAGKVGADLVTADLEAALATCGIFVGTERAQLRA